MLGKVKTLGEERLRVYLMKRHKVKNRKMSTGRFPSRPLYAKYGLFKVPATAG
jgi:RNA-directed DNA polymerase